MATELNVIAPYSKGWGSKNAYDGVETRLVRNVPANWEIVLGYNDLTDLINKVEQYLLIDPDHPCLKTLEIHAHGSPISIDGMTRTDVNTWSGPLKMLKWCDEAAIYLAGCNTGLIRKGQSTNPAVVGPIAKQLANAMAFNQTTFPHKITVYGSNGYLYRTHAEGTEKTVDSFTQREFAWSIPPWKTTVWEKYKGGSNSTGNTCWLSYKNGNW